MEFSNRERDILKILGKKKLTLQQIADELFKKKIGAPFDPLITINNSIGRVIKKCKHYDLPWTLEKTKVNNKLSIKKITLSKS